MTKVEELKGDVLFDVSSTFMMAGIPKEDYRSVAVKIDSLIAAVHAEGVAEGAEQMRTLIKSKVVNLGFHLDRDPGPIVYVPCWILDNTPEPTGPVKRGDFKVCLDEDDDPSVLAPTKEGEK